MKLNLRQFSPSDRERRWVNAEIRTARFIRTLWKAAGRKRREPAFIALVMQFGWTNVAEEPTRKWRNRNIADYLGVEYESDDHLAGELKKAFPRLKDPAALLRMRTGITHYYTSLRPATLKFVKAHAKEVAHAFQTVSSRRLRPEDRTKRAAQLITGLGPIHFRGRRVSLRNGLTPALACLDPDRKFPIMNDKTKRLLRVIGEKQDADGAAALCDLIGLNSVKNSFELDVYAATQNFPRVRKRSEGFHTPIREFKDVGWKSEIAGVAHIVKNRLKIQRLHNELTNKFRDYLKWRTTNMPKESRFDAVIFDWKKGRHLLIEAKTASEGVHGRGQIRQAIGQLFDYRYKYAPTFSKGQIDLAVLLPSKPSEDVIALLESLQIKALWFKGNKLAGTIEL